MKKFNAIEWQSFSLKKDIEVIKSKLGNNNKIQNFTLFELALVVLGASLQNIFGEHQYFWLILAVLAITPFFILSLMWIYKRHKKRKRKHQMDTKSFIDAFDNEIVYYTLISESYGSMLTEALLNKETHVSLAFKDMIHLYYIQASYYFQKTILDLAPIVNIAKNVLSNDVDSLISKKLISLPRYKNIIHLLTIIYGYLDPKTNENIIKNLDRAELMLVFKLNEEFKGRLDDIDNAVGEILK